MHVDPMDWIRQQRSWAQFERFRHRIGRIPGSAYNEAIMLDRDLAALSDDMPKSTHPQLFRFDVHMQRLTDIGDILYATAVARGGGDVENARLPRPLIAADHLDLERRQKNMNKLFATWFPDHLDKIPKLAPRR